MASSFSSWRAIVALHSPFWRVFGKNGFPHCITKLFCFFPQKYKEVHNKLEYVHKKMLPDVHRRKWNIGDWTDETDHMLLILQSILNKQGEVL